MSGQTNTQAAGVSHRARLQPHLVGLSFGLCVCLCYLPLVIITKVLKQLLSALTVLATRIPWLIRMTVVYSIYRIFNESSVIETAYSERHINDNYEMLRLALPYTYAQDLILLTISVSYPFLFRQFVLGLLDSICGQATTHGSASTATNLCGWRRLFTRGIAVYRTIANALESTSTCEVTDVADVSVGPAVTRSTDLDSRMDRGQHQATWGDLALRHIAVTRGLCGAVVVIDSVPLVGYLLLSDLVQHHLVQLDWYLLGYPLAAVRGEVPQYQTEGSHPDVRLTGTDMIQTERSVVIEMQEVSASNPDESSVQPDHSETGYQLPLPQPSSSGGLSV